MRVCIIDSTHATAPILKRHLPLGVTVLNEREDRDNGILKLMLVGDGLPIWCQVPDDHPTMRCVADLCDGVLRLVPGSGIPIQQMPEGMQ
jgi:hypothetical protein